MPIFRITNHIYRVCSIHICVIPNPPFPFSLPKRLCTLISDGIDLCKVFFRRKKQGVYFICFFVPRSSHNLFFSQGFILTVSFARRIGMVGFCTILGRCTLAWLIWQKWCWKWCLENVYFTVFFATSFCFSRFLQGNPINSGAK